MREQQDGNVGDRYRHVRHHPVFGGSDGEGAARTPGRAGAGPRRVRPGIAPVSSRPAQPRRPAPEGMIGVGPLAVRTLPARVPAGPLVAVAERSGARVLSRRAGVSGPARARFLVRRWVAGAALVAVAALGVVALGLLADGVSAARQPARPATATVTVEAPGTVWDVADRLEPAASPAERAALVARIVTANSLTTGDVRSGQVLAVPTR